jgi:L,D-peptidoglycan transpeptidase YkuD (ErfK/YbiS/YcfS/YnhG family)
LSFCVVEFSLEGDVLTGAGQRFRAAHGRSGISTQKHEGDGATPAGLLRLVRVLYRADRVKPPACAVPVEPIGPQDGWCDDVGDAAYNKPVRLACSASHEALWREDHVYDVIGVLDWNLAPVVMGRGSAIFFHVATPDYAPTAGCIALSLPDVLAALKAGLSAIRVPD